MLKSLIRKIGGFGEFVEYKNLTADAAWNEYGHRNGRSSKIDFIGSIKNYFKKNSEKFEGKNIDVNAHVIGCIILKNCQFWNEQNYLEPTSEIIPELLEAAHIQEYRSSYSNHIQNGLLLRVDIHRLYDNNLIFIDSQYIIHVSHLVTNQFYQSYNGKIITLPKSEFQYPSKEALESRRFEFREKV